MQKSSISTLIPQQMFHNCALNKSAEKRPSTQYVILYMTSHTCWRNIILTRRTNIARSNFTATKLRSKSYQDQPPWVRIDSAGLEVSPYVTAGSSEERDTIRSHPSPLGRPLSLNRALSPNTNNYTPSCMPGVEIWLLANPSQPSLTFVKESRSSLRGKMIPVRWSRDKRSDVFKGAGLSLSLSP